MQVQALPKLRSLSLGRTYACLAVHPTSLWKLTTLERLSFGPRIYYDDTASIKDVDASSAAPMTHLTHLALSSRVSAAQHLLLLTNLVSLDLSACLFSNQVSLLAPQAFRFCLILQKTMLALTCSLCRSGLR